LPNRGGDIVEGELSSNSRVSQTAGYVAINDKSPDRCSQGCKGTIDFKFNINELTNFLLLRFYR